MSALGQKQTWPSGANDARFTSKADIDGTQTDVRFVPIDGVIGRANLWIAEDFGCCASGW
jgi:hypothetical protein